MFEREVGVKEKLRPSACLSSARRARVRVPRRLDTTIHIVAYDHVAVLRPRWEGGRDCVTRYRREL